MDAYAWMPLAVLTAFLRPLAVLAVLMVGRRLIRELF